MSAAARQCSSIEPLESRILLSAVNPADLGKGDWIWEIPACQQALGVADVQGVINYEKARGVQWITVKCGDGNSVWSQFTQDLVNRAHAAGLKIFAWAYAYGGGNDPYGPSSVQGEIAVANHALSLGADGFIIDAEAEYEALGSAAGTTAATQYCQRIRAAYPNTFLAYAPFPIISYHSSFPYIAFGKYCDAAMPQDYWKDIGVAPQRMVNWMDQEWSAAYHNWSTSGHLDSIKPIIPIGQGYSVTGADITAFVSALKTDATPASPTGYGGVSFWSCQHHSADEWIAIGAVTIGVAPKFQPGNEAQVYNTGGAGLKAWSGVSSSSYVVEPDGATASVVGGPVFSNGYERWQLRYTGDSIDRWSAQDWLRRVPIAHIAPVVPNPRSTPVAQLTISFDEPVSGFGITDLTLTRNGGPNLLSAAQTLNTADRAIYTLGNLSPLTATAGTYLLSLAAGSGITDADGGPLVFDASATWKTIAPLRVVASGFHYQTLPQSLTFTFTEGPSASPALSSLTVLNLSSGVSVSPVQVMYDATTRTTTFDFAGELADGNYRATLLAAAISDAAGNHLAGDGATPGHDYTFGFFFLAGDVNHDGKIDFNDLVILTRHYGQASATYDTGDLDYDGKVDFNDLVILARNYGHALV